MLKDRGFGGRTLGSAEGGAKIKVLALLRCNVAAPSWRDAAQQGISVETPYGLHLAEQHGCDVVFSRPSRQTVFSRATRFVFGFDLIHILKNRDLIKDADVIWTMTETEYLAVLFLSRFSKAGAPNIVANSIWLFDKWGAMSKLRRRFYEYLLDYAPIMTVHSQQYVDFAKSSMPNRDVRLMKFGVSADSFPMTPINANRPTEKIRIFAVGGDATRDWKTLFDAFGNDERFELVVAIRGVNPDELRSYANVRLAEALPSYEYRKYYRWAEFVVVPMVENMYSGITVALEAVALGVPVISSRTGGVPTYFSEGEVEFVPPGDPAALREAALTLTYEARKDMVTRAQQRFAREDYTSMALARRYIALSEELMRHNTGGVGASTRPERRVETVPSAIPGSRSSAPNQRH